MPRPRLAPIALAWLGLAAAAYAADSTFVADALKKPILKPERALNDVQDYVEPRIEPVPKPADAASWTRQAEGIRKKVLDRVVLRGAAAGWADAPSGIQSRGEIECGPGYRIKKYIYEAVPGLWVPALVYEPEKLEGKHPIILNVNGHDANGKAADYKQIRCINLARRGVIMVNVEWFNMGQFRSLENTHGMINHIDLCGTTGVGAHYLLMKKAIDHALTHPNADPDRLGVTGLSGGGWQTIFYTSLDPRISLSVPVAGYSPYRTRIRAFSDLGDSEQTPTDLGTVADYDTLTALRAPRPTLLVFNQKDNCCFAAPHALPPLLDAAGPFFKLLGKPENLRSHINHDPGTHNYLLDNRQQLYKAVRDYFFAGDPKFDVKEAPTESEVKTPEQLKIELPAGNATLSSLALDLSKSLPTNPKLAATVEEKKDARNRLGDVTRFQRFEIEASKGESETKDGITATPWNLKGGVAWHLGALELVPEGKTPKETVLLLDDGGRKSVASVANEHLSKGHRVVALDLTFMGDAEIPQRGYLWQLMISTIGDRSIGLQAGEIAAVARWLAAKGDVSVVAVGKRTATAALIAAALEPKAAHLTTKDGLASLKDLIANKVPYESAPELFCFGLLEAFDIPQIQALTARK